MASLEKNVNDCDNCQNEYHPGQFDGSNTRQPVPFEIVPGTSSGTHDKRPGDYYNCARIRDMMFIKNCYKNVPAPSERFLASVNCAVIKTLQEIDENHKLCVKKHPKKQKCRSVNN